MRTLALVLAVAVMTVVPNAWSAAYFTVSSTSMTDGARIPIRFAADDPKRPCRPGSDEICPCPGQNVSPHLRWRNAPEGTKSFAILMYDIDGRSGSGVSHWVAYNIAPTVTELLEGDGTAGRKFTGGQGTRGEASYLGPCPPRGDGPHHYTFTVIALDLEPTLPPDLTREAFLEAVSGHQLAASSIGGLFARTYE
jgi:Raf kinase inhibitor-like YbhB/YbcL family protein